MDDLFQEMALQVWRSIPAYKGGSSASTWIYRVAINSALNWVRKERRYRSVEDISVAVLVTAGDGGAFADERLSWLYSAIHELEAVDRSIALLLLEGFSYKEMAAVIGISVSHIGVKVVRIKKQLITLSKKTDHHGI